MPLVACLSLFALLCFFLPPFLRSSFVFPLSLSPAATLPRPSHGSASSTFLSFHPTFLPPPPFLFLLMTISLSHRSAMVVASRVHTQQNAKKSTLHPQPAQIQPAQQGGLRSSPLAAPPQHSQHLIQQQQQQLEHNAMLMQQQHRVQTKQGPSPAAPLQNVSLVP